MKINIFLLVFCSQIILCYGNNNLPDQSDPTTDSIVKVFNATAKEAFLRGDFDESREYLENVLDLKLKYYPHLKINLANTYNNLARAYVNTWDYETAIKLSLKAIELYTAEDSTNKNIGSALFYLSQLYINLADYEKSLNYFSNYVNFNERYGYKLDDYIVNYTKGIIFHHLKDYVNAIKYFKISDTYSISKYGIFNYLALCLIQTSEIDEAEHYYQVIFQLPDLAENEMYMVYLNYGIFLYEQRHDLKNALHYFDLALESANKYHSDDIFLLSMIYQNYGEVYFSENEVTKALSYFQKALIAESKDFNSQDFLNNPSLDNIHNLSRGYKILKLKARALQSYYQNYNDIRFLKSSLEVSGLCFEIIDKIRYRISSEGSLFSISENEKDVYTEAVSAAYHLYELTGDNYYINKAFQVNEMSKSFVLISHLRTQDAMFYGNIPAELLDKEKELNRKLSLYEEHILLEKQKKTQDIQRIKTWEELLIKYNLEYDILLKTFETEYPEYYNLKYSSEYIIPEEIYTKLRQNDAVIEYALNDNFLYSFVITGGKTGFYRHEVISTLENECNEYYRLITTQNFSNAVDTTFHQILKKGKRLYDILLKPFEEDLSGKNLIIIADGEISYLPFDALITEEADIQRTDYRRLPYLLYKNSVGYSYSATLHFKHNISNKARKRSVLAFGPTYENIMVNLRQESLMRKEERRNLVPLPGVKEEINNITKYMDADIYADYQATESAFKKHASEFDILHLAMHTILNDNDPLYSRMAFTQFVDDEEDGFLHAFEVYNMQLNAKLAVLSSCSSGFGKLQEGEGMQSLARGFSYAGCPSILMSLWEVADIATVEMMDNFYLYLVKGYSKPEALRLSKLDYIKKSDGLKSNPFFWSGFIILGDSSPLFSSFRLNNLLLFIIPVIVLFLIIYGRKLYIKRRNYFFSWYSG